MDKCPVKCPCCNLPLREIANLKLQLSEETKKLSKIHAIHQLAGKKQAHDYDALLAERIDCWGCGENSGSWKTNSESYHRFEQPGEALAG